MADTQNTISDNALLQQGYTYKGNSHSYSTMWHYVAL